MNENILQFGDILLVRNTSFLAKGIQGFMYLYSKIFNKKWQGGFNHNAIIINIWGEKWVAEANGQGFEIRPLNKTPYYNKKNFVILRDKRGFTENQIDIMSKKMIEISGIRYQYEGLAQWILYILSKGGIDTFNANDEKALYCSEAAAVAINSVYPNTFDKPNRTNPYDHLLKDTYNIIDTFNLLK
jgi:hypothetical protein